MKSKWLVIAGALLTLCLMTAAADGRAYTPPQEDRYALKDVCIRLTIFNPIFN